MSNRRKTNVKKSGKKPEPVKLTWRDRLRDVTSVVTLIVALLTAIGLTFGLTKHFIHGSPAKLTSTIQKVTVQQDVTWSFYRASTSSEKLPPSLSPPPDTPGILIQIQAQLSGYESHSYSGDVTLLNPQDQVTLNHLSATTRACSEAVPKAAIYGFALQCWIGEPKRGQKFLVQSRLYYTGLKVIVGSTYVPVNPQYLAILDTGVFASTGR